MAARTKGNRRLTKELLETANDMRRSGVLSKAAHEKITMRHLDEMPIVAVTAELSPAEIRALRVRANLSQAVFARFLNLTVGYVSQLERGEKRPTGAALALLNVIKRKGIEAVL
jgi:putative transcriptional regulator